MRAAIVSPPIISVIRFYFVSHLSTRRRRKRRETTREKKKKKKKLNTDRDGEREGGCPFPDLGRESRVESVRVLARSRPKMHLLGL